MPGFNRRAFGLADSLREALRGLKGLEVSLGPPGVRVTFRGKLSLPDLFTRLNDLGEPIVVAVDEAQELRKAIGSTGCSPTSMTACPT